MRNTRSKKSNYDQAKPSLVTDLARVADEALLKGDRRRCVTIINDIYGLLDHQASHQPDLEPDLTPSPFCFGIPI